MRLPESFSHAEKLLTTQMEVSAAGIMTKNEQKAALEIRLKQLFVLIVL